MRADVQRKRLAYDVAAVVVAAGKGTRMGGISKPEIRLDGKTLFERVLSAFLDSSVKEIIVVCGENRPRLEAIAQSMNAQKPIRFVLGGASRTESVCNGVLETKCPFVCVHDCARPFVTAECIEEVILAGKQTGAATACAPVTDTVKYVDEEQHAIFTPKREHLLSIQTPQAFEKDAFMAAYAMAKKNHSVFTDETSLLENASVPVAYVQNTRCNIKLTSKEDLLLARAILAIQKKDAEKA